MTFIIIVAVVIYFIAIAWTWQNLGIIEKKKKVIIITIESIVIYTRTWIIFQVTKGGINYENTQMQKIVQNILVAIFAGVNGLILMPQIGKIIEMAGSGTGTTTPSMSGFGTGLNEKKEKQQIKRRIIILVIVFIICIIFELGYMKDTQEGIIKVYNAVR